jgi:hypothetical protein
MERSIQRPCCESTRGVFSWEQQLGKPCRQVQKRMNASFFSIPGETMGLFENDSCFHV